MASGCGGSDAGGDGDGVSAEVVTSDPKVIALDLLEAVGPVSSLGAAGDLRATSGRPSTVAVIGDSLTLSAEDEIEAAFASGSIDIVGFDGRESRRTARALPDLPSGVDAVTALSALDAETQPDLWVIALGTNDVGAQQSAANFRSDVEEVLDLIPAGVPVIWLDVWIEARVDGCVTANRVLRQAAAERPGMSVVDWFQYGDDPGMVNDDGIHLAADGQAKFAALMMEEINLRFGFA